MANITLSLGLNSCLERGGTIHGGSNSRGVIKPITISACKLMEMKELANSVIDQDKRPDPGQGKICSSELAEKMRNEMKEFDEKFGRSDESIGKRPTLMHDVKKFKKRFYIQRAGILQLREEEDFKEMNSFIYKAKSQAIRDEQLKQKEVFKQDEQTLLREEIERRYEEMKRQGEREEKERSEKERLDGLHLESLKLMGKEKESDREIQRLQNQYSALIRKNHTAFRLKKRLDELKEEQQDNAKTRALQRGVFQNRAQMQALQKAEDQLQEKKEKEFFEWKAEYLKKYNDEKEQVRRKKQEFLDKIHRDAEIRFHQEKLDEEMSYIRERDLADKKWRSAQEELERKKLKEKEELKEEVQRAMEGKMKGTCRESERERREFQRIVRESQEDIEKEKNLELAMKKRREDGSKELLCLAEAKRKAAEEERRRGVLNAKRRVLRDREDQAYHHRGMLRELQRLRTEGLEEKYVAETFRHCGIPTDLTLPDPPRKGRRYNVIL